MIGSEPFAGRSPRRIRPESLGIWDSSGLHAAVLRTWCPEPLVGGARRRKRDWDAEPAAS
jgi:hypothetical protein